MYLSDNEFELQFANGELKPENFDHLAHLRLAWIHIKKYGIGQAIDNIREQLKAYTSHVGAADKYNETVTIAAIRAVYHFMLKSDRDTFEEFIKVNSRLVTQFGALMSAHYSFNIFDSDLAKKQFVEPDLLTFD